MLSLKKISHIVCLILLILSISFYAFASIPSLPRQSGAMIILPLADYEADHIEKLNRMNTTRIIDKATVNQMEEEGIAMPASAPHLSIMAVMGEQSDANLCKLFQIVKRVIADYIDDSYGANPLIIEGAGQKKLRFHTSHCANIFRDKSAGKTGVTALIPDQKTLAALREINRRLKIALEDEHFSIDIGQFGETSFAPHITLCFGYTNEGSLAGMNAATKGSKQDSEIESKDSDSTSIESDDERESPLFFDVDLNALFVSYQRVDERGKIKFARKINEEFCSKMRVRPKMSEQGYLNTVRAAEKQKKTIYHLAFEARKEKATYPLQPGKSVVYKADELEPAIYYYEYINRHKQSSDFKIIPENDYLTWQIDLTMRYPDSIDERSCLLHHCMLLFEKIDEERAEEKEHLNRLIPSILFYTYGINVID